MSKTSIAGLLVVLSLAACTANPGTPEATVDMDKVAHEYLLLELSMGLHDEAHVDAYFGPAEIRFEAESARLPLAEIDRRAAALEQSLAGAPMDAGRLAGLLRDKVDLVLAGHTHGGQVNPVVGVTHVKLARLETALVDGRYQLGTTTVIVTAGVGYSIVPVRYAAPGSIELIELRL